MAFSSSPAPVPRVPGRAGPTELRSSIRRLLPNAPAWSLRRISHRQDACLICSLLTGTARNAAGAELSSPDPAKAEAIKPLALKKLKARLIKPPDALKIISELKTLDPEGRPPRQSAQDAAEAPSGSYRLQALTALRGSTSENLLRLVEAETGALTLLGDSSAIFVRWTGVHENGPLLSTEEASICVYWWGYEIALPPPAMSALAQARSTQRTILWFLQVYVAAGGAPELAPFVRFISAYLDFEWQAIKAQDKGKGVVLAATWLLPVALVPRPWNVVSAATDGS